MKLKDAIRLVKKTHPKNKNKTTSNREIIEFNNNISQNICLREAVYYYPSGNICCINRVQRCNGIRLKYIDEVKCLGTVERNA